MPDASNMRTAYMVACGSVDGDRPNRTTGTADACAFIRPA